jgi:hypothetical protein
MTPSPILLEDVRGQLESALHIAYSFKPTNQPQQHWEIQQQQQLSTNSNYQGASRHACIKLFDD